MDINELNGVFNWTMTFRKNSDIFLPYGRIVQIKDHPPPGPDLDALIKEFGLKNQHLAHNRTNDSKAAWFVSNCKTKSALQAIKKDFQHFQRHIQKHRDNEQHRYVRTNLLMVCF